MKMMHYVAFLLVIVGGLNWGLIGLFNFNLVMSLFGGMPGVESFVYILVGLSSVWLMFTHKADCKTCAKMMK